MAKASRSKLMNKLKKRSKGGWKRARSAEAKAKGSQLPGGLINAIAKLSAWKMDEDKNGNPYFTLTGTVKEPEEYEGMKATVMHFIKATQTKTVEDKLEELSSDLQLLSGDQPMGVNGVRVSESDVDDLPDIIEGLVEDGPYFKFNTWKPDEDRSAMVFIQGLADDYEGDDEDEDYEEEDAEEDDGEEEEYDEDDAEEEDGDDEDEEEEEADDDADDDEEEDEDDDWEPQKEDVYLYKASPRGKPQECEVRTVSVKAKAVTLKRVSDGKVFKGVSWDKLEGAE